MNKGQIEEVKKMRNLRDPELMDYYENIVVATHHARVTAKFDDYDKHYPILQFTREEIARRLNERHMTRPARFGF